MATRLEQRVTTLPLIRIAYLGGVLLVGGVSYYMHHGGGAVAAPGAEQQGMLRTVGYAIWGGAIAGMLVLRSVFGRAIELGRRANLVPIGWAMGEMVALYGAVIYFLTGEWQLYIAGLVVMVVSFSLFPIPRR